MGPSERGSWWTSLPGTSAGGINAIFLGKAFANGQTLDQVSRLWLDQADVQDLLNRDKLPRSLLSSQTMYAKLLDAFPEWNATDGTRFLRNPKWTCIITATDIQGLELPIELADKTVFEKRHKNVFQLRFGDGENHFAREKNPFLAFAARATSAFPFAFEPARLQDGGAAKQFFPDYGSGYCRDEVSATAGIWTTSPSPTPFRHCPSAVRNCRWRGS